MIATAKATTVKSAVRTLETLEFLARSDTPLSLRDIVTELGYPVSSAFALLQTLRTMGYVIQDKNDRYALHEGCRSGPSWTNGQEARLIATAHPFMEELRDQIEETVFLGMRARGGRVRSVVKVASLHAIRYDALLSTSDPAFCTAMGRVLLAFWNTRAVDRYLGNERLVRHTEKTVVDRTEIRAILENVRRNGYAICDEELELGGSGAAAPVFGASGEVIAALNVATPSSRFHVKRDCVISAVTSTAALISRRAGYFGKGMAGSPHHIRSVGIRAICSGGSPDEEAG